MPVGICGVLGFLFRGPIKDVKSNRGAYWKNKYERNFRAKR